MKTIKILSVLLFTAFMTSCDDSKSLQKYYVESQEDTDFLALDVPTSMFTNLESLNAEQRETMESIKKVNVLALRADQYPEKFETEKARLDEIFTSEKYKMLMKYGGGNRKAAIYFTGEDDAIDELIVYGYDDEKGLGVARILGKDMNPEKIMQMMKSLDKEDINMQGFETLAGIIDPSMSKSDSTSVGKVKDSDESLNSGNSTSEE
ncbi:DUF4252 domain-containing protein [Gramella sp. GC03-9]|uniref:DUF4252 domain-containing protein n=1 Tax=Christiangramia oceanisediminis TaxID=2920386 RepID=A0A9X2KXJ9_9FLAO|nr:DUF4252 domain-containing protein [Gramella oceanisediminis]MCP9200129.1 DUF4252 domain-containing protein [Gramella oceanisediminis]